ncbi:MAG: TOBE domain-containing protein [Sulfuricella sp.]|nr:TOBE domain-containing protein [Sulfuricella sp.]
MAEPSSLKISGRMWLSKDDKDFAGQSRIDLLEKIDECGSITRAAKAVEMSYKAAWDAIDMMNNLSDEPLVATATGGKGGGGTRLTEKGKKMVQVYRTMEREHRKFLDALGQGIDDLENYVHLLGRLFLRTSARNQFFGKIVCIRTGPVTAEVELAIGKGDKIAAVITRESVESLGLKIGTEAWALVKAPWVILTAEHEPLRTSARNRLCGMVSRITEGGVDTEVVVELDGGNTVSAVVTHDSAVSLELAPGKRICAIFKASSVIIGLTA